MAIDTFEVGGTELNAVRTAEALERLGHQLVVFHAQADGPLFARWRRTSHRLVHTPMAPMRSPRFARDVWRLGIAIQRHAVSLVHCQDVYTNIWVCLAARTRALPPIITSRRWDREVPRQGFATLNALAHRRSRFVTVNSSRLTGRVIREGVSPDRVAYIPNFISPEQFADHEPRRRQLRQLFGFDESTYVVGMVGRLVPVKRFDLAIQAFSRLAATTANAILAIVGAGPEAAALAALVDSLGLSHRVQFLGHRSDSWSVSAAFDCFLLSSDHEGFSNALLEASANGVPVVSTDVGGAEEVLRITGGIAVPTGDADALATALLESWRARDAAWTQAQRHAREILHEFSESQVMTELLDVYARAEQPR